MRIYDFFSDLSSVKIFLGDILANKEVDFYLQELNKLSFKEIYANTESGYSQKFWHLNFMSEFRKNAKIYLSRIEVLEEKLASEEIFKSYCTEVYNSHVKSEENIYIRRKKNKEGRLIHRTNLSSSLLPGYTYKQEGEDKWFRSWAWSFFIQPVFCKKYSEMYGKAMNLLNDSNKIKIMSDEVVVEQEKGKRILRFVVNCD